MINFASSVSGMDPAKCTAGETAVENFVKFQCITVGKIEPIGCVAPNGAEVSIGQTTNDDHFQYICVRDGKTVRFYATGKYLWSTIFQMLFLLHCKYCIG